MGKSPTHFAIRMDIENEKKRSPHRKFSSQSFFSYIRNGKIKPITRHFERISSALSPYLARLSTHGFPCNILIFGHFHIHMANLHTIQAPFHLS